MLEARAPGPTATAVGLDLFRSCGVDFDRHDNALHFLQSKQVTSDKPELDGGWPTNTSFSRPVMEATGWVARALGSGHFHFSEGAPEAARAYKWILSNQNNDGGWGSFLGAESRSWTTCLALRALAELNPHSEAVENGVRWLLDRQRHDLGGWGYREDATPTVTHTSFALLALSEVKPTIQDERIDLAYNWIANNVDATRVDDPNARVESYNTRMQLDGDRFETLQTVLPHYGLPYAVAALLRHPSGGPPEKISQAFDTMLDHQLETGAWPNIEGGSGQSIWAVAPFVYTFRDLQVLSPAKKNDQLLVSDTAVVIQRSSARDQPLVALIRAQRRAAALRALSRHWATALLALSIILGMVLIAFDTLQWTDYILGLILPLCLFAVQEVRNREPRQR